MKYNLYVFNLADITIPFSKPENEQVNLKKNCTD